MTSIPVGHDTTASNVWDWPLQHSDGVVRVTNTNEKFEVGLDVQFFTPNEIEVRHSQGIPTAGSPIKVKVAGQEILINCRHESRTDQHGTITREVHRAYKLPADVDAGSLKSHLSSRGVLTITAQKKH